MIRGTLAPGQIETLRRRLESAYNKARQAMDKGIRKHAFRLAVFVQSEKLSGQVLNVRTGLLRRSIQPPLFEVGEDATTGIVGRTMPGYGKMFEAGFQGDVRVAAHERMMSLAFGRPIQNPRKVTIAAYTRRVNIAPRAFLQTSLSENEEAIRQDIRQRVMEAVL